jgi:hypothetical protein
MIANGVAAGAIDEYVLVGESTPLNVLESLLSPLSTYLECPMK